MNSNFTHISVCLDRSGSMETIKQDTIGGYNRFLEGQRAVPGHCTLTLVQFDTQGIDTVCDAQPVAAAPLLNNENYHPRGGTPLYDAIAHTIGVTGRFLKDKPEAERPAKVICVIITDGEENSSRKHNREGVFALIKQQREVYKWEFVFIGANQDAMAVGIAMGIAGTNCMTATANAQGTGAMYGALGSNVRRMRSAAVGSFACNMAFTSTQQDEQDEAAKQP